jgi:hypothetical protein
MGKIIKNGRVYAGGLIVDAELDTTSENPVQNKAVASVINEFDSELSEFNTVHTVTNTAGNATFIYVRIGKVVHARVSFTPHGNVTTISGVPTCDSISAIGSGILYRNLSIGGTEAGEYYFYGSTIYLVLQNWNSSYAYGVEFSYIAD